MSAYPKLEEKIYKMALKTFTVKLTGTDGGSFNTVDVKIAETDIKMISTNGEVTWVNAGTELDVPNPVAVFIALYAINTTTWDIEINEKGILKAFYQDAGVTGEILVSRGNERIPNYSERKVLINW